MGQVLVFKCGAEEFALPIEGVREVRRLSQVHAVPHTRDFVEGVIHLRGRPVALINLARRFGLGQAAPDRRARIIVARLRKTIVGLIVDAVYDVFELPRENVGPPPGLALPVDGSYIREVGDIRGRIIYVLDLEEMFSQEEALHIEQLKNDHQKGAVTNGKNTGS